MATSIATFQAILKFCVTKHLFKLFFLIDTRMTLVIHDFSRKFFCLQEKIFTEACLSIIHKTIRVNLLNTRIFDRQTEKLFICQIKKNKNINNTEKKTYIKIMLFENNKETTKGLLSLRVK